MAFDAYTKFLSHWNGQNGGKEIIDSGATGHVVTLNGTAQTSPRYAKFGDDSIKCTSGDVYLSVPDHADWNFGSGNFVIDFWVYPTAITGYQYICGHGTAASPYWRVGIDYASGDGKVCIYEGGGTGWHTDNQVIFANQWTHVAIVRSGSTAKIFINGTSVAITADGGGWGTMPDCSGVLYIGKDGNANYAFEGYIDEFRISKGTDRSWTGSTITLPTAEYSSDADTKLLLHLNGTLTDSGNTGHTVTNNACLFTAPKIGNSSIFFDGDSDYLTIPNHADFSFGTNDWTIESFVKCNSFSAQQMWIGNIPNTHSYCITIEIGGASCIVYPDLGQAEGPYTFNISAMTVGQWHHLAFVMDYPNITCFLDGVKQGASQSINPYDFNYGNSSFIIGNYNNSTSWFNGYIDEFRMSNIDRSNGGASFTVPTSPYTSDANTKLLLHGESHDVALYKPVTFVGTAQISTAQAKFNQSLLLDGDSDYVTVPDSADWDFGTGDFTIDFWLRFSTLQNCYIIDVGASAQSGAGVTIVYYTTPIISLYFNGSDITVTGISWTPSANTWYHIALVRSGTTVKFFVDGTQVGGNITNSTDLTASTYGLTIGKNGNASNNYVAGYIDELRISKGIARWTSDFTPPTSEYSDGSGGATPRHCVFII